MTAGTTAIEAEYKPGKSIHEQKDDAISNLDKVLADTVAKIKADPTLTDAEKTAQEAAATAEKNNGVEAINAATTPEAIRKAVADGTTAIEAEYKPGKSVADQKTEAKADLDKVLADTVAKIKADPTLTDAEKTAQENAATAEATKGKEAIDRAENAQGIANAVTAGTTAIEAEYKPGKSVTDQKTEAIANLDKVLA
ncbi:DUF1542 domain-containing protein, partial [Acinetobacter baumannii]|uniref:DUF1542 domain-containing protein n=1 Tax=Acinetobacter baumannii TaxID=470 RepID=UPI001AECF5BA|nr:DUF1542 domain-containing protein [Acinetobacter baumannii]